jgi:hypothetical protein
MRKTFYLALLFWTGVGCVGSHQNELPQAPVPTHLSGQQLAAIHCGSCHLFPDPQLLDKSVWEKGVLPEMAYRLGMKPLSDKLMGLDPEDIAPYVQSDGFPANPVLVEEDWQKIIAYYVQNAPEHPLPQPNKSTVKIGLPYFKLQSIPTAANRLPKVTMVKIDPAQRQLLVGRRDNGLLELYNPQLQKIDSTRLESSISAVADIKGQKLLLEMGLMDPNDRKKGKLIQLSANGQSTTLLDSLQRPVDITIQDLNEDGVADFLLCNYGNELGRLAWYDGKTHQEQVLKSQPGARVTYLNDLNKDGRKDIVVLMCQARESVLVFYNLGKGKFKEEKLLEFPPVYGSSFIDLADMNQDGKIDILYTNGDNADYSYSLKAYHGLRIFLNDGRNHFKESFFYPAFGASKAVAADFDADGDQDIAMISFFNEPDAQPNSGFLFFENQGQMQFKASTFSTSENGKWLVMDVGDLDGDQKPDIVLGSFFKPGLGQGQVGDSKISPAVVWLKNTAPARKK